MIKIKDLWIMSEAGVVLFDHRHLEINPNLFGAMMSALNNYANIISEGGIMGFELNQQKSQIHIYKHNRILFVANCSMKLKEKKIRKALEEISVLFFEKYQKLFTSDNFIRNWNGEVTEFSEFGSEIEDYLVK